MSEFPARIKEISADLITRILKERTQGVVVEKVNVLDHAECGDGMASTADRVILSLDYAEGKDAGLPNRILLKTILIQTAASARTYNIK